MGFFDSFPLRLANPFRGPAKVYRSPINTGGEDVHMFAWLESPKLDDPIIVANETRFQMPEETVFVKTDEQSCRIGKRTIPLYELKPQLELNDEHPADVIPVPEPFRGKWVPEVDRSEAEIKRVL